MMDNDLIRYNEAYQALILAKDVVEVKEVMDRAETLRLYAKKAGKSLEMQNLCADIKLEAEWRAGELLKEIPKNPGTVLGGNIVLPPDDTPTLEDIGVSKIQSSRWQQVHQIPIRSAIMIHLIQN